MKNSNGNGNGNGATPRKNKSKSKDGATTAVAELESDKTTTGGGGDGDSGDAGNDGDGDAADAKVNKAYDAKLVAARADLFKAIAPAAEGFAHATLALYPNLNGRSMIMKNEERKSGRGAGYEIEAMGTTAHTLGVTVAKTFLNPYVLKDEVQIGRAAAHMGQNYLSSALMYRNRTFDLNQAEKNAMAAIRAAHGEGVDADPKVRAVVKEWVENLIMDSFLSEPHGNRNTARGGVLPCTALVSMNHGQAPNLVGVFERPVEAEGDLSESDVATARLARGWRVAARAMGKRWEERLRARGGDGKQRVAVYCQSEKSPALLEEGGLCAARVEDMSELVEKIAAWIDETRGMGGNRPLPRVLGIHMLKVVPATNQNRDDEGKPKQIVYGGFPRVVWTSQAENAAARATGNARLVDDDTGSFRTNSIVKSMLDIMGKDGESKAATEAVGVFAHTVWGNVLALLEPTEQAGNWCSSTGFFPGHDELSRAVDRLRAHWTAIAPIAEKTAAEVESILAELESVKANK